MIVQSILHLCLEICLNLHPCLIAMDLLWEYLLKYQKVPFGHLRSQGRNSVVYVADLYLQENMYQSCLTNILDTVNLLRELGFVIHQHKLLLTLSQTIVLFRIYYIVNAHDIAFNWWKEK